ncbi:MAG: hypothetical protein M0Z66_01725 [Thermaerobacter sp.]|nr:hypothetical protein [Thermaerobacter sp.]
MRELAVMGVRLIAVYTLIPAFSAASSLLLQTGFPAVLVVLQAVFMVVLGVALWLAAPAIGGALSRSQEPLQGLGLDLRYLGQVGFGAVGLVLAVQAVSGFAQSLAALMYLQATEAAQGAINPGLSPMWVGELAGTGIQILLGAAVFLGRRGLARALSAVRNY